VAADRRLHAADGDPIADHDAPTQTKTSYDPVKDFAPISMIGSNPFVLVAHPSVPAKNLTEFVSYARGQQDGVNYAHAGMGTIVHLAMVVFQRLAGSRLQGRRVPGVERRGQRPHVDLPFRRCPRCCPSPTVARCACSASRARNGPSTPEEFSAMIAAELTLWAEAAQMTTSR
jgi:Tripartite tricarboxylate transporter family receptor